MPLKFDLSRFNYNNIFIETGTFYGSGVKSALKAGFKKVISIELDKNRYIYCKNKFRNNKKVTIIQGDSGKEISKIMKTIKEPCTFWLDSHYNGEPLKLKVAIGDKWTPIVEELEAIRNHHIKNHTILIDDMRCMDNTHIDKRTNTLVGFPGKQNLLKTLKEINNSYTFEYLPGVIEEDVLAVYIKEEPVKDRLSKIWKIWRKQCKNNEELLLKLQNEKNIKSIVTKYLG